MLHPGLIEKALDALVIGEMSHWRSTLKKNCNVYRIRMRIGGGKRISIPHLRVLWMIVFGKPSGVISNACGDTDCINPYHYRDEDDRQQAEWKVQVYVAGGRLLDGIVSEEVFEASMQVRNPYGVSDEKLQDDVGLTNDFGCYYCGKRFDPLADRNDVICPECWTDQDQEMKEANSRD